MYHRQHRPGRGKFATAFAVIIGVVLIVGGLLLGLIPGVPGIVLGIIGIALLGAQFRFLAMQLDRLELWLRRWFKKPRRLTPRR